MKRLNLGFTLIELMITVVIIGILASIAYPTYTRYVQEARVTDGQAKLMEIAGQLERCYTSDYSYSGCLSLPMMSENRNYKVTGEISASTYTLTATHSGSQVTSGCETLTLDQTGNHTPNDACW